jgi:Na+/phosphate symporter
MREDIKGLLAELHDMSSSAENCISLLQASFIYNAPKPLSDCREAVDIIKNKETGLTKKLTEIAREDADIKPYVSIPGHISRIAENIEKLSDLMNKKIKDDVLFSDKAMTEITFLFQRLIDILRPTSDMLLAKNVFLSRYVQESESGIANRAAEYATQHEERLIEGLCLPAASAVYINMLDSIKNIAWHAKEIAARLVGWMMPKA